MVAGNSPTQTEKEQMRDRLRFLRDAGHLSYFMVAKELAGALAPVVSRLAKA